MIFLFKFLGSFIFWIIYFVTSFIIGSILVKYIDKNSWHYCKTGEQPIKKGCFYIKDEISFMIFRIICIMFFWPIILLSYVLYYSLKICFGKIILPLFKKGVISAGSMIPDIIIKKDNNA